MTSGAKQKHNVATDLDVCVICEEDYEKIIQDLNHASDAGVVNLYVAGNHEAINFVKENSWNFNSIYCHDCGYNLINEAEIYNHLANEGKGDYILILRNGAIHGEAIRMIKQRLQRSPLSSVALSMLTADIRRESRFTYTCTGIACLDIPTIPRGVWEDIGGLETSFESLAGSIHDLTLKLYFNNNKILYLNHDYCVYFPNKHPAVFYPTTTDGNQLMEKWCHRFPDKQYGSEDADYKRQVRHGYSVMKESTVVICGLARDIAGHLKATGFFRMNHLAKMFKDHRFVIFENDSEDETRQFLSLWQRRESEKKRFYTDKLDLPRLGGMGATRVKRMARYRNKCLRIMKRECPKFDYYVVLDLDLTGGFSYDGIAHTIGAKEIWSGVGSNGKNSRRGNNNYWDTFAHRDLDHGMGTHGGKMRLYHGKYADLKSGDPMVEVNSCFGGLGVYKMKDIEGCEYTGEASEHVPFHRDIREKNNGKIFLNPSQVVLYNLLDWCEDENRNLNFHLHKFYEHVEIAHPWLSAVPTDSPLDQKFKQHGIRWWHSFPEFSIMGWKPASDLERELERIDLPKDMTGMKVLDVGASDGFFSFECERRGADVTSVETITTGFEKIKELGQYKAEQQNMSIYNIPDTWSFDLVLCLGVIYHLQHPLLALQRLSKVTKEIIVETAIPDPQEFPLESPTMYFYKDDYQGDISNWWIPNPKCVMDMLNTAGFRMTEEPTIEHTRGVFKAVIDPALQHKYLSGDECSSIIRKL